ncbi:sensor histidine kinase [Hymenobacter cheonanensis]|uniref:sensor histidine kinase n=1 Tax=Hymenobacter sp. CA2-7 TaxID=3063993 RepID=UPI0027135C73|nr:ATP-binding protein [Hymenobacter sp. CA2-7]MDO7887526.1 ATP-binding protein [Hymenobacter sp. CA2-7]
MAAPSAIGLVYWGRKALDLPTRLPRWDRWLTRLWRPAAAITTLGLVLGGPVLDWLDDMFLAFVLCLGVAIGWRLRAYRPAQWLAVALAPGAGLLIVELLARPFSTALDKNGGVDTLEGLVICWLGAWLLVARSQAKTLSTEEQARLAAEQEQRAIATQSQTLEYEVSQRTAALARQTDELRTALAELQATQDQLIQSEKMASLGELTAGIAHEIQNPLNFVNNFADVSVELVAELAEERARPARDRTLEAELLADLRQNLQRIAQHGGRAAGIVRGMLEHSRASTGERQPTDVNALADEYLRLAYHGLRAKDKSFNATLLPELAPGLPLVEAVPGDLGRVLLNLFTNAFYAVQKRQQAAGPGYAPTVQVRTEQAEGQVRIMVSDNGTGMPAAVRERIFQPFFTTKPSGEGTGLGLSLAHDIIEQGHGGTLTVASQEGEGTTFTITLPLATA